MDSVITSCSKLHSQFERIPLIKSALVLKFHFFALTYGLRHEKIRNWFPLSVDFVEFERGFFL